MKRIFLLAAFLCLSSIFASAQTDWKCVQPSFLKAGDTVAVIAPSFAIYDSLTVRRGCDVLRNAGLVPVTGSHIYVEQPKDKKGHGVECYTGTLDERLSDFQWAYMNPNIKAVICARGGYGGIQMLDYLPLSLYSLNPKWLVGFSDITNFLAASTAAGVMSIHGDMLSAFGGKDPEISEYSQAMIDMLFGKVPEYNVPACEFNVPGHAEGMLVGGNAITYEVLIGTKYDFLQYDNIILFIEEVGETMHAIDRFINTLKIHGCLSHLKGIIVGNMRRCDADMNYDSVYQMLSTYTSTLGIPVSYGLETGHGPKNWPIIIGAPVTLDVNEAGSKIHFNL